MAVLTDTVSLKEDIRHKVDKFAQAEERDRDDIVNEAIDSYLKRKAWDRFCESGFSEEARKVAEQWLTDEDVIQFVDDEMHSSRGKEGNRIRG